MSGPLEGINVLEMCMAGVGPYACSLLGALGANVVKIEPPGGDIISIMAPYQRGVSAAYTHCNLNKRSVVLDLKKPEAVKTGEVLLKQADVFVENMRPGKVAELGLGYERARELSPGIVYASAPAWGLTGPMRDMPAIDGHIQMFSGFASLNGEAGGRPEMYRYPLLDWTAGAYLAAGVITGLLARWRTGAGQRVVMAHLGSGIAIQTTRLAEDFATGVPAGPMGSACSTTAPHEAFLCQDGKYLAAGVVTEEQWRGLCQALRQPELAEDARFATNRDRVAKRGELSKLLAGVFKNKPARWWVIQLSKHRVPCSLFLDVDALVHHQQVVENRYIQLMELPHRGSAYVAGLPWRFSLTPVVQKPSPITGEQTEEISKGGFGTPRSSERPSASGALEAPLAGLRVIDMSQGLCGPYASLLLAESGAEVVKIEPPEGDYARCWAPAYVGEDSAAFVVLNRNKKSVIVDPREPRDRQALKQLIAGAQVLLEDFGNGAGSYGVDMAALCSEAPGLVQCSISAFGERGPLANIRGSELTIQAASDMWRSLGAPGKPPLRAGADVVSLATGIQAYTGISAALLHQLRTGAGQRVEVSMFGTALNLRGVQWAAQSDPDEWYGFYCDDYVRPQMYGYRTADYPVFFNLHTCTEDDYFRLLIRLGMEEALTDPRFENGGRDAVGMGRYSHEVLHVWERAFAGMTSQGVVDLILEHHGMAIALNDHSRLFLHQQVRELDLLCSFNLPGARNIQGVATPFSIDGLRTLPTPSPRLGEHTLESVHKASLSQKRGP